MAKPVSLKVRRATDALLLVDVQNDFCPGGALAVAGGDQILPPLNRVIPFFDTVVASQDWHPPDHCSFADGEPRFVDGSWPVHCVAETPGAALHAGLALPPDTHLVRKATERARDAYSAFDGTGLTDWLRARGIRRVFVGGLATDYCVKATVLDARAAEFETIVLRDAIRAVADEAGAIAIMTGAGACVVESGRCSAESASASREADRQRRTRTGAKTGKA